MITSDDLSARDLVVCIPNELCGEVGEPLGQEVCSIIRALAKANYCPLDFGENTGVYTELWFCMDTSMDTGAQAEHFIRVNGEV